MATSITGTTSVDTSLVSVEPWARRTELRGTKYVVKPAAEIEHAIQEAFAYDPRVRSNDVKVSVTGRRVTLSGEVPSLAASYAAERIAKDTVGVAAVANTISVASAKRVPDGSLQLSANDALRREPFLDAKRLSASVKDGTVVLTGNVLSNFPKAAASAAVASLRGVKAAA